MSILTAEQLLHAAVELELAPGPDLQEAFREAGGHNADAASLGRVLVRRELLTGYQIEKLLAGSRSGLYFGPARILYRVGAGSFARVYRAIHRETGAVLAVKVLRRRHSDSPEKRDAFLREGEMGRLLRHPNIVSIEEVGQEQGAVYLVMEFLEGQTLRELVRIRGAIDVPKGIDLVVQMAAGLEYAHRRGVAHRDLKASNVLVSSAGVAKLVDFGLARVDASGDKVLGRGEQPRTLDYAALEKLTGMHDDDFRSDIYFLGTIAYLVFSGTPALRETRDRGERGDPQRFQRVEPLAQRASGIPREVCDVVGRMMHLDPLERWQTIGEVKQALERLQSGRGSAIPTSDTVVPARARAPVPEGAAPTAPARGRVMIVESSQTDQETLRDFFTKLGCRVLLTSSPARALARFSSHPLPADCIVMSARSLGSEAVAAFNTISSDPFLSAVPAILLVDQQQRDLVAEATFDARRKHATLPPRAEEIGPILDELVTS